MRYINELDVYANGKRVGELRRIPLPKSNSDEFSFQYNADASPDNPISLLMPVREEPYISPHLHTVFQSSLPEGALRRAIVRRFKSIIYADDMGILRITGQNRVGNIQCIEKGGALSTGAFGLDLEDYKKAKDSDINQYIERAMTDYAEQSGVSGVMPKVLTKRTDYLTLNAKERIIKMDALDYPYMSTNEYFCLTAARNSGMSVPDAELIMDGHGIAVTRFDITDSGHRLGFEDMCSIMGLHNEHKYNSTSEMLARFVGIIIGNNKDDKLDAMTRLYKATVFSHAIRNGDAHLKNYGILFDGDRFAKLAPIFDLITTTAFADKDKPALNINNKEDWASKEIFFMVGKNNFGLNEEQIDAVFSDIEQGVNVTASEIAGFLSKDCPREMIDVMHAVLKSWEAGLSSLSMGALQIREAIDRIDADQQECLRSM